LGLFVCLFAALGIHVFDKLETELLSQGSKLFEVLLVLLLVLDLGLDTCGGEKASAIFSILLSHTHWFRHDNMTVRTLGTPHERIRHPPSPPLAVGEAAPAPSFGIISSRDR
jgi:hypothetical protein